MNDRGTYGSNGHSTNGHNSRYAFGTSVVGDEASSLKRQAINLGSLFLSLGFGALTGHLIAKDPNKGLALGLVGGFFAHMTMEQTSLLRRIEQKL